MSAFQPACPNWGHADWHLLYVTHWLCIGTSYNHTSKNLNYPFKATYTPVSWYQKDSMCLTTVPYMCMCHLVLFTVPFVTMWSPWGWHKEERSVHSTRFSSTDISNDLWYYCVLVRQVGFSLCSQMWQGYLYPVVSSLNAPAVTLLRPLYFSSSKLCLTEVHLNVFIKGKRLWLLDEEILNAEHELMCELGQFGHFSITVCVTEFSSQVKH